jgi:hypothetical protein
MITIASTLGVAYLVDLQKSGHQLITQDQFRDMGLGLLRIPMENKIYLEKMVH